MSVRVESYSGYSAEETPRRFEVDGEMVEVVEVVERWRTPLELGYRVRASDGRSYVLRNRNLGDGKSEWVADLVAG